ncbi:PF05591 domain protein [Bordetella hinzii L60]|nr:PF05591 domain protein [Bordetella hinzii L60]
MPDTAKGQGNLRVVLEFSRFADFHPESLVQQVPRLKRLLEARHQLRDLLAKLDGNDELDSILDRVVRSTEELKVLHDEVAQSDAASPAEAPASGAEPS